MARELLVLAAPFLAVAVAIGARGPASGFGGSGAGGQQPVSLDQHPAIQYATRPTTDPVTQLIGRQTAGTSVLAFDDRFGYLPAVLDALKVPLSSQILTFARTGIQGAVTGPKTPRAFYFNDSVIVGYISGAPLVELASHDPEQGVIFFSLSQDPRTPAALVRRDGCITCHLSANSLDVPGLLVRSNFVKPDGNTIPQLGNFLIDHRSPFDQRWGGWYVTGTHGSIRHMGNSMVTDAARPDAAVSLTTLNRRSVAERFDAAAYPHADSDLIALMVFEHQAHAINLLTRLGWETRIASAASRADFSRGELSALVRDLVDYLVFVDEPALTDRVEGTSDFAREFSAAGRRDSRGRSLRDFDRTTRLMRYPCSFMIESPAFDALPAAARDAVYRRLWQVLSGEDTGARYARLPSDGRSAAIEIIRATKANLPAYWRD